MKISFLLLITLLIGVKLFTETIDSFPNSKLCVAKKPDSKGDCHGISPDFSDDQKHRRIACCYVTYSTDDDGKVKKCVPMYKTLNGLHMYKEQLKNFGATSVSINCSSQKIIASLLIIFNLILVL